MRARVAIGAALSPPLIGGAVVLAAIGFLDCTAVQVLRGQYDHDRTLLWCMATLLPLMLAAALIASRPMPSLPGFRAIPLLAGATFVVLAVLLASDALLFPLDGAAEAFDRARSKLPGAAAFVALGAAASLLHQHSERLSPDATRSASEPLSVADRAAVERARLAVGAGNYVELQCEDGRTHLIRLPLNRLELLREAKGLKRLHRSALVRASAIARWHNDRSGLIAVELDDGTWVRIGRSYRRSAYALRNSCNSSRES